MNKSDVANVLAVVAAGDRRTVGETDIEFWHTIIGDLPKDLALQAVRDHFRNEPGVWLEPGHVVKRARALRNDMLDRENDYHRTDYTPEEQTDSVYPGDVKAAPGPGDYPREWSPEQRLSAYWHSVRLHATPTTTEGWRAIAKDLEDRITKRVPVTQPERGNDD